VTLQHQAPSEGNRVTKPIPSILLNTYPTPAAWRRPWLIRTIVLPIYGKSHACISDQLTNAFEAELSRTDLARPGLMRQPRS